MKVLIDGDSLVYTIGFASQKNIWQACDPEEGIVFYENETKSLVLGFIEDNPDLGALDVSHRIEVSPETHAFHSIKLVVQKICARAKANSYKIYLTGSGNFRESLATIMGYKHNRVGKPKPLLYEQIRSYLQNVHKAVMITGMEADDALSIVYARSISDFPSNVSLDPNHEVLKYPEESIIAAIDKDLRNIPGKHINFDKHVAENGEYKFIVISEEEGRHTFWKQVLTGDTSDNILGVPRVGPGRADTILDGFLGKSEEDYFWAVYGAYKVHYGYEPFEYFRYDAYVDTTKGFTKRELKPEDEILPEQRLQGTALTMLLENARLLWMLRVPPNAEGTHWWMPPMDWADIELYDQNEKWLAKDAEDKKKEEEAAGYKKEEIKSEGDYEDKGIDTPWTESRGKWFVIADYKNVKLLIGPVGTEKKAKDALKDFYTSMSPDTNTDDVSVQNDVSEPMTEENQILVGPEETAKINGIIDEALESGEGLVVTDDALVTEPEDNASEETHTSIWDTEF